ncbi:MAG: hypothetical protein ACKD6O_07190 [Candidatus Bathyarchaeota archaeon]
MNRYAAVALIILTLLISFIVVLTSIKEKKGEVIEKGGEAASCPVTNSTYSFCFIKDGKAHYFDIIGWVSPNTTILERYIESGGTFWRGGYISYGKGVVLFLALRTNLEWEWYISCVEALVGEIYKECLLGSISNAIQVNKDTFLVPYVLEEDGFWESYKIVSESYIRSNNVRLYFEPRNFLNLKSDQNTAMKIGKITIMPKKYNDCALCIYVDYPPPRFGLTIKSIEYLGGEFGRYIFNASLQINNCSFVVFYSFNDFGQKAKLDGEFLPLYLMTIEESPTKESWIVKSINESHYFVAIPTESGHGFSVRYHYGSGFKDVWLEPQHEYKGSYVVSGDEFWLKIEVCEVYVIDSTFTFMTPQEETYKCEKPATDQK